MTFVDYVTPIPADWLNNVNTVVHESTLALTNVAAVRAQTVTNGPSVITTGYHTPGDGGGAVYVLNPNDHTSADNGGSILVDAQGNRWYLNGMNGYISVKTFGAYYDGIHDDTAAHQNALNWLASQGGGTLLLPVGTANISSTLTLQTSGVSMVGQGRGSFHDVGGTQYDAPTILSWTGTTGGTMVKYTPSGNRALRNCDFDQIMMLGNGVAATGLYLASITDSVFRLSGSNFTSTVCETHIASGLGDASDVQQNDFWIQAYQENAGDGSIFIAYCDLVSSGTQGNFSFNRMWEITGNYLGANTGVAAIDIQGADNNDLYNVQLYRLPGGQAVGLRFIQGAANQASRQNTVWRCSVGQGGLYSAGTEAGSYPAVQNNVIFYDQGNGDPTPAIGGSSQLWWGSNLAPLGNRITLNGAQNQVQFLDGRMRYSGQTGGITSNGSTTITFPTAFPTEVLTAGVTPLSATSITGTWSIVPTESTLTIYNWTGTTLAFDWWIEGI